MDKRVDMGNGLPEGFVERLREIVPSEKIAAVMEGLAGERPTSFRVNGLRGQIGEVRRELAGEGFELGEVDWKEDAFVVPAGQRRRLTETAALKAGRIYIQNLSSMVPPLVLAPRADEWILDLTAAPGSKTVQLAAMMGNQGRISAVERSRPRFFRLLSNLKQQGVTNVSTYLKDGAQVWRVCPEQFDRVLLDGPCSAEGQFNGAAPERWANWSEKRCRSLAKKQARLLRSAVLCLKPGGVLVYSTCTLAPEENEKVVQQVLEEFGPELAVEPVELGFENVQRGLRAWRGEAFDESLAGAVRILPDGVMEGFFVCRIRKSATSPSL